MVIQVVGGAHQFTHLNGFLDEAVTTISPTNLTRSKRANDQIPPSRLFLVIAIAQDALYASQVPHSAIAEASLSSPRPQEEVTMSGYGKIRSFPSGIRRCLLRTPETCLDTFRSVLATSQLQCVQSTMRAALLPVFCGLGVLADTLYRDYPHLIIPLDAKAPDKEYGTVPTFHISNDNWTAANWDVPNNNATRCQLGFTINTEQNRGAPWSLWGVDDKEAYLINILALENDSISTLSLSFSQHYANTSLVFPSCCLPN
ncbi:hypothetical protein PMIN03_001242 [Paraphaeosphaeria minitans]